MFYVIFFMILRNSKESMSPSSSSEFWCARIKSMLTAPLTESPPSSSKEPSSSFAIEVPDILVKISLFLVSLILVSLILV